MKRVMAIAVLAMLVLPGIAWAGSSRDAALAVGALAALGTVLLGAAALAHPVVVAPPPVAVPPPPPAVYAPPPPVYAPPPPVVYAPPPPPPPPVVYAPAPPVVYAPAPPVVYGPPPVGYGPPAVYAPAYRHGRYAYRRHHDWRY